MERKETLKLVLDDGGPIYIWKEDLSESLHHKLLITTSVCINPECDCRAVSVSGIAVDDRYENIEWHNNKLSYSFRPGEGESSEVPLLRQLFAEVNIDSGEVKFSPTAPPEQRDEELLGWLRKGLDEYQLERLRKRWRIAKGIDQDGWTRRGWSWWEPGDMVSWAEVFPDENNIIFASKGDIFWADDMYCINPGCSCKEAGIHFTRITTGEIEDLGAISVSLPGGRFRDLMGEQGNVSMLKHLWDQLRKRPKILTMLNERMRRIKPIGREIVRLSTGGPEMMCVPSRSSPGRNEPCPCGSGKKYKRCCGG